MIVGSGKLTALSDSDIGCWDNVNSTDVIQQYIREKMTEGIQVSHMLKALETEHCESEQWEIWLGNSMEIPSPINTKEDLVEALGLSEEDLEREIAIEL